MSVDRSSRSVQPIASPGGDLSMYPRRPGLTRVAIAIAIALAASACATSVAPPRLPPPHRPATSGSGQHSPLSSNAGGLARQELAGVEAAADFVNADGGVDGRRLVLDVQDLDRGADAPAVMRTLKANGVAAVIGAYSSDLSIPASQAASGGAGLLGGRSRRRSADRPRTAAGVPRGRERQQPGFRLGVLRSQPARAAARQDARIAAPCHRGRRRRLCAVRGHGSRGYGAVDRHRTGRRPQL